MTEPSVGGDDLLGTAVRLLASVEALAALAAYARLESEPIAADPEQRAQLEVVTRELLGSARLPEGAVVSQVVGMARAFLRQALDLVEDPGRSGGWDHLDPELLQGIGRVSGSVVVAIAAAAAALPDLGARFASGTGRFLDVGTGTGWLAIAVARAFPELHVVGLDLFDAPLALARGNVDAEGLAGRIKLRLGDVVDLDEPGGYDAVWLALPFIPRDAVPGALDAVRRALRPGGWVLPGIFAGPPDRLSEELIALRTVRAGGHPWTGDELLAAMEDAGFTAVQEVPRRWPAPVRLFAGRA